MRIDVYIISLLTRHCWPRSKNRIHLNKSQRIAPLRATSVPFKIKSGILSGTKDSRNGSWSTRAGINQWQYRPNKLPPAEIENPHSTLAHGINVPYSLIRRRRWNTSHVVRSSTPVFTEKRKSRWIRDVASANSGSHARIPGKIHLVTSDLASSSLRFLFAPLSLALLSFALISEYLRICRQIHVRAYTQPFARLFEYGFWKITEFAELGATKVYTRVLVADGFASCMHDRPLCKEILGGSIESSGGSRQKRRITKIKFLCMLAYDMMEKYWKLELFVVRGFVIKFHVLESLSFRFISILCSV